MRYPGMLFDRQNSIMQPNPTKSIQIHLSNTSNQSNSLQAAFFLLFPESSAHPGGISPLPSPGILS